MTAGSLRFDPDSGIGLDELRRSLVVGYAVGTITAVVAVLVVPSDRGNIALLAIGGIDFGLAAVLALGRSLPGWVIKRIAFRGLGPPDRRWRRRG